jgi:hypothetical protein
MLDSIGDCRELGGLAILKGSHRNGYLPIQPARASAALRFHSAE